jgi:hypothetical protein
MFKSKTQWHCGTCSQCIDRRFAITAAGLQSYDSEVDYVSDVFLGPRKDGPEKNIAADYTRHGIELARRSESELTMLFNAELSRAVRYEPKRSEAAGSLISMHKRHGETVLRVLEQKVSERASDLLNHTLVPSSLLALALDSDFSPESGQHSSQPGIENKFGQMLDSAVSKLAEKTASLVIERIGRPILKPSKKPQTVPDKRDTILFAAIVMELKGLKYCVFLDDRRVKPKWSDAGPNSYCKSYEMGNRWRKKVQDEKSRAKTRMNLWNEPLLREAYVKYLPDRFDEIAGLLNSRNSRSASTFPVSRQHA